MTHFNKALLEQTRELSRRLDGIGAPDGIVAYNPLAYAMAAHERYLNLFEGPRRLLIVGMNPGPWGMVQTGVPFGNVETAKVILDIVAAGWNLNLVQAPDNAIPARPVAGYRTVKDEVSGRRFWSGLAQLWDLPEDDATRPDPALRFRNSIVRMLGDVFVMNLCPLAFFSVMGSDSAAPNITPDKLQPRGWRDRLVGDASPCRDYFHFIARHFQPEAIVVMGEWVQKNVLRWNPAARVVRLPHPSPASPKANAGWAPIAQAAMRGAGLVPEVGDT